MVLPVKVYDKKKTIRQKLYLLIKSRRFDHQVVDLQNGWLKYVGILKSELCSQTGTRMS